MKKIRCTRATAVTWLLIFVLLACTACTSDVTLEEVSSRAAGYYPDEVSFQFVRQDQITDVTDQDGYVNQECYLFDVIYEEKKVSGVAVGVEDGSIWILDMLAENLWLNEKFMGLPPSGEEEKAKPTPVIDLTDWNASSGTVSLFFACIDTIPEFSDRNEGSAQWDEKEKTLSISAVKNTGSVTGAMDGPWIELVVTWKDGEPEVVSVEYRPAPAFSHPSQVLFSGEVMDIEEGRLIEIAEHFRALMLERIDGE